MWSEGWARAPPLLFLRVRVALACKAVNPVALCQVALDVLPFMFKRDFLVHLKERRGQVVGVRLHWGDQRPHHHMFVRGTDSTVLSSNWTR